MTLVINKIMAQMDWTRIRVRRHMTASQRWRKISESLGWAGLLFYNCPDAFMERSSELDFNSYHDKIRTKRVWLYKKASGIFDAGMLEFLFSPSSGIIVNMFLR